MGPAVAGRPLRSMSPGVGLRPPPPPLLTRKGLPATAGLGLRVGRGGYPRARGSSGAGLAYRLARVGRLAAGLAGEAGLAGPGWRAGVGRVRAAHAELLAAHPHLLEVVEDFARHALGQFDQAVVVADVDAADVAAFQVGLVGDGTHAVGRLHPMRVADLDAEAFHADLGRAGTGLRRPRPARGLVASAFRRLGWPPHGLPRPPAR